VKNFYISGDGRVSLDETWGRGSPNHPSRSRFPCFIKMFNELKRLGTSQDQMGAITQLWLAQSPQYMDSPKHLLKFVFEADFGLIVKVEKNEPLVVTFSSGLYYNIVRRQLTSPSITSHISPLIRDLNFQSI